MQRRLHPRLPAVVAEGVRRHHAPAPRPLIPVHRQHLQLPLHQPAARQFGHVAVRQQQPLTLEGPPALEAADLVEEGQEAAGQPAQAVRGGARLRQPHRPPDLVLHPQQRQVRQQGAAWVAFQPRLQLSSPSSTSITVIRTATVALVVEAWSTAHQYQYLLE